MAIMLLLGAFFTTFARAEEARLTDIVATNDGDYLRVYFSVTDCFTDEMKKAIENGINITFTFLVTFHEIRNFKRDREIADIKVSHGVVYDNLKKIYKVRRSESDNTVIVEDFQQAKDLMSKIVGLKIAKLRELRRGGNYQIGMMAELDKIRLPLHLHYVFFFLSLWDFETEWHTINLRY